MALRPTLDLIAAHPGSLAGVDREVLIEILAQLSVCQGAITAALLALPPAPEPPASASGHGFAMNQIPGKTTGNQDGHTLRSLPDETAGYLSIKQLAAKIPYAEKTIRNLMLAGEFIEGRHFFRRRRRVIFLWPAVKDWIESQREDTAEAIPLVRSRKYGRSR